MIMGGDRKKIASVIVARFGKKPDGADSNAMEYDKRAAEPGKEDSELDPGEMAAAEEMHAAMKSGDVAGMASALKNFIEICYANLEAKEEPEEEEKPNPILG